MKKQDDYLFGANSAFLETLYADYLEAPERVSEDWQRYFRSLNGDAVPSVDGARGRASSSRDVWERYAEAEPAAQDKQVAVIRLIEAYRILGHLQARLDPLGLEEPRTVPDLDPTTYGLSEADLDTVFYADIGGSSSQATLRRILQNLQETYCGTIGSEYMHITEPHERLWIQERLERGRMHRLPAEQRLEILERLVAAEGLERYLHSKYVGQKRFSLEGAESVISLLDNVIQRAGERKVEEVVLGMAHRGRLNVLTNILGRSPQELYREFEGRFDPQTAFGSGDVKYHQGFSSDLHTPGGPIHAALFFNPSHLEIINPVVEGSARARQHRRNDQAGNQVLPLLLHGDASFAGQGVVMETFNMSQARGFCTGGTLHVIINNQIGFTISNPMDARSTPHGTEVARMVQAPIFHVNGDDPDAVIFVTELALDFRMTFKKDVVIDVVCYRRHGHNEADEPAVTQPMMYQRIRQHPRLPALYAGQLIDEGLLGREDFDRMVNDYRQSLENEQCVAPRLIQREIHNTPYLVDWKPYKKGRLDETVDTGVPEPVLRELGTAISRVPEGFQPHNRVERILEARQQMAAGEVPIDWGFAETLAYATLLRDGHPVRLTGQDSGRGTFFHRHAVLYNQVKNESYVPLRHLGDAQNAHFIVVDSLLSEMAVLGFEYGYSTAEPNALVIWEAQYGDFVNNAQVVIDQFISSGEAKWNRLSGLALFLPHGYEGQGPEHSSARIERFLQLCAGDNMQVCVPTLPAQLFHMLRRQMRRKARKPLVVFTPKSLLRHRQSVSSLADLAEGAFQPVLADPEVARPDTIRRVILCSGKVYFDLAAAREAHGNEEVAILRVEELYPFPKQALQAELARFPQASSWVWCQDEPENQGAWGHLRDDLQAITGQALEYAGRAASAAPAVGYLQKHNEEQRRLVEAALGSAPTDGR